MPEEATQLRKYMHKCVSFEKFIAALLGVIDISPVTQLSNFLG